MDVFPLEAMKAGHLLIQGAPVTISHQPITMSHNNSIR